MASKRASAVLPARLSCTRVTTSISLIQIYRVLFWSLFKCSWLKVKFLGFFVRSTWCVFRSNCFSSLTSSENTRYRNPMSSSSSFDTARSKFASAQRIRHLNWKTSQTLQPPTLNCLLIQLLASPRLLLCYPDWLQACFSCSVCHIVLESGNQQRVSSFLSTKF